MRGPPATDPENQLDAFADGSWPYGDDFPHNRPGMTVAEVVEPDLGASSDPLVITGYSSLARVVALLARLENRRQRNDGLRRVRVLLGHEPHATLRPDCRGRGHSLGQAVRDYWLERGVSLHLSAQIVAAKELLCSDIMEVRTSGRRPIHAKMFVTETGITLGSSNYSTPGMLTQLEANVRFVPRESGRFQESRRLAEALWHEGDDYLRELQELLDSLLQWVTWEEALGRACAELLHGEWARRYLASNHLNDEDWLWPTQEEGIAQALWVLENVGSVLVADATGSGKTKMGAHIVRALEARNWRTGRIRKGSPVIICPPAVKRSWRREATRCGQAIETHSHGILSTRNSDVRKDTVEAIRRAQVLAVDEAHNFLNRGSVRTRTLYANMADYVLLFTATPINRGAADLLPLIDLLGGDNFDEDVLRVIERVWRRKRRSGEGMAAEEKEVISGAVQAFTVRRTKRMLNAAVDEQPEAYRNAVGVPCRYPAHRPHLYDTGESEEDRAIAREMRVLARQLRGITHFATPLRLPEFLRLQGWTDARYLSWRLKSASALAAHGISAALRSSRAALFEHLVGSKQAAAILKLGATGKSRESGNMTWRVEELGGSVPPNELETQLPEWLKDPSAHEQAAREEADLYRRIRQLALDLSPGRDSAKVALLSKLVQKRRRVLAFDRHPITLAFFKDLLLETSDTHVILATGSTRASKKELERVFALDSDADAVLALCSDALSEGINLQGAPVLVHLDMPTVIRLAEQRIGRVDRMDSLHIAIDVYWPDDSPEFALHADEVFLNRHQEVADLLGSNVPLPEGMRPDPKPVPTKLWVDTVEKYVADEVKWDGITDVFEPVRHLVEGATALVSPEVYSSVRHSKARLLSAVSVVQAPEEWSFYAIGGSDRAAPRWVFFDHQAKEPVVDLHEVVAALRTRLAEELESRDLDQTAATRVTADLERLQRWEPLMLPRKKQRALQEMQHVLGKYRTTAREEADHERELILERLLNLHSGSNQERPVNLRALADWWIDVIRPVWHEHLSTRRRRPALLRDIRKKLLSQPLSTQQLLTIEEIELDTQPLGERVVAAIVAMKQSPASASAASLRQGS